MPEGDPSGIFVPSGALFAQFANRPVCCKLRKFIRKNGSSGDPSARWVKMRNWSGAIPPLVRSFTTGQIAWRPSAFCARVCLVMYPFFNRLSMSLTLVMIGVPSRSRPFLFARRSASSARPPC